MLSTHSLLLNMVSVEKYGLVIFWRKLWGKFAQVPEKHSFLIREVGTFQFEKS